MKYRAWTHRSVSHSHRFEIPEHVGVFFIGDPMKEDADVSPVDRDGKESKENNDGAVRRFFTAPSRR